MWVSFHPLHRARSASKKGTWPLPSLSSQAAALREQGERPSYPTSFFSILLGIGSGSRQACLFRESQHEVHGLNGLACSAFHKVIQRSHRNDRP